MLDANGLRKWLLPVAVPAISIVIAVALFALLLGLAGRNPLGTLVAIANGAFGSAFGIEQTLTRATPLLLCALAVAVPARAGLFNIGGEGQLYCGAIAATAIALHAGALPAVSIIPMMLLAALVAGALWALIPAILKTYFSVNEILVALMLNYVAIYLAAHLVHGPWRDPSALGWPYSASFPEAAVIPTWGNSNVHLGLLLALCSAVVLFFVLRKTVWGFSVRVIEANPTTAQYVGIRLKTAFIILMLVGGALAAVAGLGEVSVIQGRLRTGISPGYGYVGFLIAWMVGHRFLWIILGAIVIGGLYAGTDALQLTAGLPSATTDVFMGIVFIVLLVSGFFHRWIERRATERGAI